MSTLVATKNVRLYLGKGSRVIEDMRDRYFYLLYNTPQKDRIKPIGDRLEDLRNAPEFMWKNTIMDFEKSRGFVGMPEMRWVRIKTK
jgi:hypothetical protein